MKVESASNNEPALADRKAVSRGFAFYLRRDSQLYLLLLIPMAFVLVFKYAPMSGLVLAFKDYKIARGFWGSEWVGFEVFAEIFAKHDLAAPSAIRCCSTRSTCCSASRCPSCSRCC
ncbi:hypothetical protein HMSSN036_08690 [Paenibacillus macerans]|nr:hypothetical protein HMSSN036_08690 [Paenibacillus macerans]